MKQATKALSALACAGALASAAQAATDPTGDFLATYTGPQNADLDFTDATARFDGTHFNLGLTLAGPVTASPGLLHVWGINRGAGTPRLNILFDPDLDPSVKWDAVAVLFNDRTLRVVTFPQVGPPTITAIANGVTVNGNSLSVAVPLSLLPSRGYATSSYTFQLWSRLRVNPMVDGPNTEIADFGPRLFAAVPEPASWALMIAGFGLAGAAIRRRHTAMAFG
jgi:hypothetical protein